MEDLIQETINDTYLDMIIDGVMGQEKYDIRVRKNFSTACWSYKDETHVIFIGEDILKQIAEDNTLDTSYYISSFLYHEVSHAVNTIKDLSSVTEALGSFKIPFSIFNLAEDARIEHLMREKTERKFLWSDYETIENPISAVQALFNIIQSDGKYESDMENFESVFNYYLRFTLAKNSYEVVEILTEWMEEFPETENQCEDLKDQQGEDGNPSDELSLTDLMESAFLQASEERFAQAMKDSISVKSSDDGAKESESVESATGTGELNSISIESSSTASMLYGYKDWDIEKSKDLSLMLENVFSSKKGFVNSKKQSKRLNTKAFRPYSYTNKRYKRQEISRQDKKNISIVVDCSGSMHGQAIDNMKIVLGVFNELCKSGYVDVTMHLSGVRNRDAIHETFKFPVTDNVIGCIPARYGAEGLESCIRNNMPSLKNSDFVFVLTDGDICDTPINKEDLHAQGIYTTGIFIGAYEACYLNRWFDKGIAVLKVEDCVDELVSHLSV